MVKCCSGGIGHRSRGKYEKTGQYKPSWTLHRRDGSFFILDGYGLDFIHHYDAAGKYVGTFGGEEGGIVHWGPHGGMIDGGDQRILAHRDE